MQGMWCMHLLLGNKHTYSTKHAYIIHTMQYSHVLRCSSGVSLKCMHTWHFKYFCKYKDQYQVILVCVSPCMGPLRLQQYFCMDAQGQLKQQCCLNLTVFPSNRHSSHNTSEQLFGCCTAIRA
jgi:hypothetical protein